MTSSPHKRFTVLLFVGLLVMLPTRCAKRPPDGTKNPTVQEIKVEYSPDRIAVKKGQQVRLVFYRDDDSECTAKVDIPDLKIKKDLPVKQETAVELTPAEEGEYTVVLWCADVEGKTRGSEVGESSAEPR